MKNHFRLSYIIMIIFLLILLIYSYYQSQYRSFYMIGNNFCKQNSLIQIAKEHGLTFQLADNFDMPAIVVHGKQTIIDSIEQELEQQYPNTNNSYYYNNNEKHCYLNDVKHNVTHVNKKLLPYIPDDAHYVSYSPKHDKAVYCYYGSSIHGGSKCYFVKIKQQYGFSWLEEHDISDMERNNIGGGLQNYTLEKGKTINDLSHVYSYVYRWLDNPNETVYPYGFIFMTNANGYRWYFGERY